MDPESLLAWYRPRRNLYPWRSRSDPYRVLVSEFMLQQTQSTRVIPAFRSFLQRFPSVEALAAAPRREVLRAWAGLGYNRRAVALSDAARRTVADHGGIVPSDPEVLVRLPGIGPYTAAAVASISYGVRVPAVDTNARRVVARAVLGVEPAETTLRAVREPAARWMDGVPPGQWNQAVMDLGREVCRPIPRCDRCPLARSCAFRRAGRTAGAGHSRHRVPYEGSFRQLRGTIVRLLRERPVVTLAELCRATDEDPARVASAVRALASDGLVAAGSAALDGRPRGRVRLAN